MDGVETKSAQAAGEIYKFGGYYLNPSERRLAHNGKFIDIKPRTFEVLCYLVSNSGDTVTKDQILEVVWEGSFVEESNLAVHISRIRKILEKTGAEGYIQTISGSGYQFVERVENVEPEEWQNAVAGALPLIDPYGLDEDCESVAVLPLFNETGDPEVEYLADGITEALINSLSCRRDLKVIARNTVFRFKNEDVDVVQVGKRLNVTSVMTGRLRIIDDEMHLTVELAKAKDGTQLWGGKYDESFSEIFEMQDHITNSICESLNSEIDRFTRRASAQKHTKNTESYRLYLKGEFFVGSRRSVLDLEKAKQLFQTAINLDPAFAASYVSLANCLRVQYLYQKHSREDVERKIERLLETAIAINPSFVEYHVVKGYFEMFFRFNFRKAESHYQRALSMNPGSAAIHNHLARLYIYEGKLKEGLSLASESARLDPVSYSNDKNLAKIFLMTHQYENAILRLEECLELAPNDFEALVLLGFAKTETQEYIEALECYEGALTVQDHMETLAMKGYTLGRMGERSKAQGILRTLKKIRKQEYIPGSFLATVFAGLGNQKNAIKELAEAVEDQYIDVIALKVDPRWDELRNSPEFLELVEKVGI